MLAALHVSGWASAGINCSRTVGQRQECVRVRIFLSCLRPCSIAGQRSSAGAALAPE